MEGAFLLVAVKYEDVSYHINFTCKIKKQEPSFIVSKYKKLWTLQLFVHCLAPDTADDLAWCDNVTAVIVQFQPELVGQSGK